jgi:drug/metabolite transporter (DMT)-like permease
VRLSESNGGIITGLVLAVILWGANNTGMKFLLGFWPPIGLGCVRFLCAGVILWFVQGWWQGRTTRGVIAPEERHALWWRTGLTLAVYIVTFNWALVFAPVSHVALYLGAAPIWALLLERQRAKGWRFLKQWMAAGLALSGVVVLFWPAVRSGKTSWMGELLGLGASVLWAIHGRECGHLGTRLTTIEITAHTMLRAGIWLLPLATIEFVPRHMVFRWDGCWVFGYTILGGGVAAFVLWNQALTQWSVSRVFLFNNLIPISSMAWAHVCLGEPATRTFALAMVMIVGAVLLAQTNWEKLFGPRWLPSE